MSIVTERALIREMDADELREYLSSLLRSGLPTYKAADLLYYVEKQYHQVTGEWMIQSLEERVTIIDQIYYPETPGTL